MRLVADRAAELWLIGAGGVAPELDWDSGNEEKSSKHGVEPADVAALVGSEFYFAGRIVEPAHDERRWLALGQDGKGRFLALIFTRRGDRVRPISCRPMRRKERAIYEEARKRTKS